MKATKLLEQQHRKVKATFAQIESTKVDPTPLVPSGFAKTSADEFEHLVPQR